MSETSVEPQPVKWGEVRALAVIVGVREAARRMGISEEAAMKRCQREGWLASEEAKRANKLAVAQRSGITVSPHLSAAAVISAEISALGSKTRLSIARGVAKAAETVENLSGSAILAQSSDVKNVAQTADLVHGWKDAAPTSRVRLDVLLSRPGEDVKEIEAEIVSTSEPEAWDDLDNY